MTSRLALLAVVVVTGIALAALVLSGGIGDLRAALDEVRNAASSLAGTGSPSAERQEPARASDSPGQLELWGEHESVCWRGTTLALRSQAADGLRRLGALAGECEH